MTDIKDLYVTLPVHNIINITRFCLDKPNNRNMIIKQTLELIKVVLKNNYFQYNDKYFKETQSITMGSLSSSSQAEIYLQYFEEQM